MTKLFRLAVIATPDGDEAVVELDNRLLPVTKVLEGTIDHASDLQPVLDKWQVLEAEIAAFVGAHEDAFAEGLPAAEATFRAPLASPGKIACIGSNYHDHIAEMPIPMVPTYPYAFMKPVNNTVRGTGQPVAVPKQAAMMDWEAELGVVIGCVCSGVTAADALDYVAAYVNFNDLSARDWLAKRPPIGVDWVQHKAFDGFAPFGPYLVPSRFVPDPQNLSVQLKVNDTLKQDSSTAEMVFGVAAIIEHLSAIMTLYPGDIIATGTPAGTGHGRGEYLKAGDVVRMQVGPLGELVTPII